MSIKELQKEIQAFLWAEDLPDKTLEQEALAHYCFLCKRGFKTKAATSSHKSIKHKHNA